MIKEFPIVATADDVRRDGATFVDDAVNIFGHFAVALHTALRITNVPITRGQRIKQANIRFKSAGNYSTTGVNVVISGAREPNPAVITSTVDWDARVNTTAAIAWLGVPSWTLDAWHESIDFSSVVQEIVNQPAWVPGNALIIFLENLGSTPSAHRQARSRNVDQQSAPIITIEWEDAQNVTTVHLRTAQPPHRELLQLDVNGLAYGEMLMRPQTASFRLSRSDANLADFGHLLHPDGPPPMYTIERYDGTHPWVGFLRTCNMKLSDPDVTFTLADHMWRLQRSVTPATGGFPHGGSVGRIVRETIRAMDHTFPTYLDTSSVGDGPGLDYEYQAQKGDTFLNQMAQMSGYEWGFRYDVSEQGVNAALRFEPSIGRDRRAEVVFDEQTELQDVGYAIDYDEGNASALVVGGQGTFQNRAQATASTTRIGPGIGGTRVLIERQVTQQEALFNAASRLLDTPEHVAEAITFSLLDQHIAGVNVGDIISGRFPAVDLSMPFERSVRILGISFDTDRLVHRVDAGVVP